jgi:hypothetical protein
VPDRCWYIVIRWINTVAVYIVCKHVWTCYKCHLQSCQLSDTEIVGYNPGVVVCWVWDKCQWLMMTSCLRRIWNLHGVWKQSKLLWLPARRFATVRRFEDLFLPIGIWRSTSSETSGISEFMLLVVQRRFYLRFPFVWDTPLRHWLPTFRHTVVVSPSGEGNYQEECNILFTTSSVYNSTVYIYIYIYIYIFVIYLHCLFR